MQREKDRDHGGQVAGRRSKMWWWGEKKTKIVRGRKKGDSRSWLSWLQKTDRH